MNRKYGLRNQRGLALWIKIVLGLFITGIVVASVCALLIMNVVKDAMDPKKTEVVANQIVTLEKPLPAPFEYGRFNLNMGGFIVALINNTQTDALYVLMNVPRTEKSVSAEQTIAQISNGQSLPSTSGGSSSGAKMQVEKKGTLDVAGKTLYYVLGKATKSTTATGAKSTTEEGSAPTVETFFGAVDPQNAKTQTLIMVQQQSAAKTLSLDEIKAFMAAIKSF